MSDSDQPQTDLPGAAASADGEAPAKPRRKRAAKPAETGGAEAAPAAPAEVAEAAEPAKPKRTRRKAADAAGEAASDVPAAAPAADAPAAEAAAKPARPRRRAAAAADGGPADTQPVATAPTPVAVAPAPAAEPAVARDAADPSAAQAEAPAGAAPGDAPEADGDGPRKRSRNRRRGKRGGADRPDRPDRPVREDGAPAENFQVVTVSATPGDDDEDDAADRPAAAEQPPALPKDVGDTFAAVLSGDYDALPAEVISGEPERRVLAAEPDAPKLHKVLAQAGIGSRRDMEALIAEGQVQVNGQVAHTGQRISFGDRISVAGRTIKVRIAPGAPRIIAYHKPVGEVVTHDDPQHRPTVFRRLPRLPHGKWQSVGRLDINTEGLLLFTNSGELANQLMHPRFGVEREYAVRVLGTLTAESRARLLEGVEIDGQKAVFKSIEDGGGEGVNHWYRVVITEGRNREVRKLFDKVGLGVSRLIRIRYGCVVLPRGLKRGVFVDLNDADVREVRRLAGNERPQQGGGADGRGGKPQRQEGQGGGQRDGQREGKRDGQRDNPQRRNDNGPNSGPNNRRNGPPQQRAERDRPERGPRGDRQERGDRSDRAQRAPSDEDDIEHINFAAIPNPLMQTFDKRAIKEARQPRREIAEDGPIPNPLEQTYDKRFAKGGGKGGFGMGGGRKGGGGGGGGGGQPDPMKTSLGYIGADAFVRKFQNQGGGGGGGGGGKRGGGGGRRGGR
ncbi:MAG TPA: pseudouridine synthase [Aquabacterium sp.]|nr:pseudouridine synthase [Aquabacterium sp.]HQC96976.1 pseudouridine synthase [Aquabacterium sp.]